jgi:RHS repeat-associated protein
LLDTIAYDAFGATTSETNPTNNDRFKWDGGPIDSVTGFYSFGWRYFNPQTGRWTSHDPMGFRALDPNLYRFTNNDPIDHTDRSGLSWWNPFSWPTAFGNWLGTDYAIEQQSQESIAIARAGDPFNQRPRDINNRIPPANANLLQSWAAVVPEQVRPFKEGMGYVAELTWTSVIFTATAVTNARPSGASGQFYANSAPLKPYKEGGGHHPVAGSLFGGDPKYNYQMAFAIPKKELERLEITHAVITGKQKSLYMAFAKSGKELGWAAVKEIEVKALVQAGMEEEQAKATVLEAIRALRLSGVSKPTHIPWGGH